MLSFELITPKDGLEEMEDEATLISSTVDINQTTSVFTKQLVTSKDDIIKYFPEILEGLGKFPGEPCHINVDPSVSPKHLPARPVPVHQQSAFKQQLDDMIQASVILPVTEATPWINSYVIVKSEGKKGKQKLHISLDSTPLNKAIIRKPCHMQTQEDIYHHLYKAKYITVVDFCKGYWQVPLDEESSYLTTFKTPFGWYHFTHLPFGINVSGDAFQRKLDTIFNPLPNVISRADDLIIWGNKDDGSDHDEALTKFLQTTKENGLKINFDKIQYKAKEVSFFGETYTTNGHRPSAEKIKAIQDMPVLTIVMELQTLLGMCQYLAKYSARTAEVSEALQQLTCKDTPCIYGPEHDKALKALKKGISAAPTLRYYDPHQPLMLQTDGCSKGLGAVLLQNGQPVYFTSKALHGSQILM